MFFFQAEDGIRYGHVTGVQTCALPILSASASSTSCPAPASSAATLIATVVRPGAPVGPQTATSDPTCCWVSAGPAASVLTGRSEERRVGQGGREGECGGRV